MSKPIPVSLSEAILYAGYSSRKPNGDTLPEYYDDGKQITLTLEEFVEGIPLYREMLADGHRDLLMVTADGEALAAVYPDDGAALSATVVSVTTRTPASEIFQAACSNEALTLTHRGQPFAVMLPYVTLENV